MARYFMVVHEEGTVRGVKLPHSVTSDEEAIAIGKANEAERVAKRPDETDEPQEVLYVRTPE